MAGKLITLPFRASLRSAQLMTRAADGAARRVLSIIGHANARHDEPVARPVSPADVERVRTASVAELAALRLYEARHRARRTVLAAVNRQLKLAAGGRPA